MTGLEILERLRHLGVNVRTDGSWLIVAPRDLLTDELRMLIRAHKPALVAALTPADADTGSVLPGTTRAVAQTCRLEREARDRRRAQVLRILTEHPAQRIAFAAGEEYRGQVAVMLAIRTPTAELITGELVIHKSRWNPWLFAAMFEQLDGAKPS